MYHVNADDLPGNDVSRTFEGARHGPSSVSFFLVHNRPGDGPDLHQHPYDETFVILEGHVVVRVGGESIEGGPGDIVIGPAATPHGFTNPGPGPARLVCIHAAPAMTTEWLD
jgi:quercetin dioxygenase-like cupin family protein